jgi:hypothetical protein
VLFHPDTQYYADSTYSTTEILSAIQDIKVPTIWLWPNVDSGTDLISKELRRYKDINLNRRFETIEFPIIKKKDIVRYIYELITYYNYNDELLLLNWINYNIELLNIENINILLFELNNMMIEHNTIEDIHKCINFIIDRLIE